DRQRRSEAFYPRLQFRPLLCCQT
ncbi:hypothetical protein ID866_11525, partial [Astraeus odoratus]